MLSRVPDIAVSHHVPSRDRGPPDSLARNIDDDGQSTFRTLFLDKVVGQELGNRGSQVNTVDKDVDYRRLRSKRQGFLS